MAGVLEQWSVAQRELAAACDLLIDPSPENLDRCSAILANVASQLARHRPAGEDARALRVSVNRAGRLLEAAAGYSRHWQTVLRQLTASGYTAAGDLDAPALQGRISMNG